MTSRASVVGLMLLASVAVYARQPTDCSPRGNVTFVCGLKGAEDLALVPGTSWVVVSALEGGPMQLVHARNHRVVPAYSTAESSGPVAAMYSACPGPLIPPPGARSITHGLNVRTGPNGIHTLYVVHHGFRESIEVFEIATRPDTPTFTWRGCILAPKGVGLNGVAPLPDGAIVATSPHLRGMADLPLALDGKDTGEVYEWRPGRDWTVVPGSASPGPNGIEASPDGRWLYIALWPIKKVMRLSRGVPQIEKTFVDLSFHPDNLRWQADGSLLTGGHYTPKREDLFPCLNKSCADAAARVARIDPRKMTANEIVSYPSDDVFFGGTAALQVGKEIWIGSTSRDRIARYPSRQ